MKYLKYFAWLLLALPAAAQYSNAGNPTAASAIPFQALAKTSWIAASGTSASIALSAQVSGSMQVQVYNSAATVAFVIACLTSTCTASVGSGGASATDYPIAPGAVIVMSVPNGTTYMAAILTSGSGAVYLTPGVGN